MNSFTFNSKVFTSDSSTPSTIKMSIPMMISRSKKVTRLPRQGILLGNLRGPPNSSTGLKLCTDPSAFQLQPFRIKWLTGSRKPFDHKKGPHHPWSTSTQIYHLVFQLIGMPRSSYPLSALPKKEHWRSKLLSSIWLETSITSSPKPLETFTLILIYLKSKRLDNLTITKVKMLAWILMNASFKML